MSRCMQDRDAGVNECAAHFLVVELIHDVLVITSPHLRSVIGSLEMKVRGERVMLQMRIRGEKTGTVRRGEDGARCVG